MGGLGDRCYKCEEMVLLAADRKRGGEGGDGI